MTSDVDYKDFRVLASGFGDNGRWVQVIHLPCGRTVFGREDEPDFSSLAELVFIAQAHRCGE